MKVAILSESPADEAALRVLVDAILEQKTQPPSKMPRLASRGWPSVLNVLPTIALALNYNTDADGLVVVVDSDDSPIHVDPNDHRGGDATKCRICQLYAAIHAKLNRLRLRVHGEQLKVAIGLATPAIEAWLHCSRDDTNNENHWGRELEEKASLFSARKALKRKVYGVEIPSLGIETEKALSEARRLAADLTKLESHFAYGFGAFAKELRGWLTKDRADQ